MLVLDGVYTLEENGPRFHRVGAPDAATLERLLNRLVRRIVRSLTRDGLLIEDSEQPWLDLEPADTLDQLNAASIRYRIAVGQGAAAEPSQRRIRPWSGPTRQPSRSPPIGTASP